MTLASPREACPGAVSALLEPACLGSPASPQTRRGPGPAGAALPHPRPAESPRELRPLRLSRLRPAPSTARAAFSTVASAFGPAAEERAERPPHPLHKPSDKGDSKEIARNSAYSWEHPGSARQDGSRSRARPGCHLTEARNIFEDRIF